MDHRRRRNLPSDQVLDCFFVGPQLADDEVKEKPANGRFSVEVNHVQ